MPSDNRDYSDRYSQPSYDSRRGGDPTYDSLHNMYSSYGDRSNYDRPRPTNYSKNPDSGYAAPPSGERQNERSPGHSYANQTYVDHNDLRPADGSEHRSQNGGDPYSSHDSGFPGSLERNR